MVKVYLSRKQVDFDEKNVSDSEVYKEELEALGYYSTPVTRIGERYIVGYKPQTIQQALDAAQETNPGSA